MQIMQKWMAILWPSFLVAGAAEGLFFSLVNPQEFYLLGSVVDYPPIATYSIGFFAFWAVCAASSWLTCTLGSGTGGVSRWTLHFPSRQ